MIKWFSKRATKSVECPFDFSTLDFAPLDTDAVIKALRINEKAFDNGIADLPPTDSSDLDAVQTNIVQYVSVRIAVCTTTAETSINAYNQRIAEIDVLQSLTAIREAPNDLKIELDQIYATKRSAILSTRKHYEECCRQLTVFKERNDLSREPLHPLSPVFRCSLFFMIAVFEGILNGFFFATGSEQGLLGGGTLALIFAFADILISGTLGHFSTLINLRSHGKRLLGWVLILVVSAWIFVYNIGIAHLREALQKQEWDPAMRAALSSFQTNFFGLEQADTWVFVALGMILSIGAARFGWGWDDPYPEYGALHRTREAAESDYEELVTDLKADARRLLTVHIDRIDEKTEHGHAVVAALDNMIRTKTALVKNMGTFIDSYEQSVNVLIQAYRDTNCRHRKTDAPSYFSERWVLRERPVFEAPTDQDHQKLLRQKKLLEGLPKATSHAKTSIAEVHRVMAAS